MDSCPLSSNDGRRLIQWLAQSSGVCIYTATGDPLTVLSEISGYISMVCWLGAQLPQVLVNYTNQSVEGLSLGFLLNWFAGDATNFLGCILTGQLPFQTVLAGYYCCIDMILGSQYIYYSRKDRERHERHRRMYYDRQVEYLNDYDNDDELDEQEEDLLKARPVAVPRRSAGAAAGSGRGANTNALLTSSFVASFARVANGAPLYSGTSAASSGSYIETIGFVFAWICTAMYLTSRLPQIMKNFRRKSTWGTSMLLFMSALTGNVTYTISILLSPEARSSTGGAFLRKELPYLIGSAGTVIFDLTIFCQFLYFGNKQTHPDSPVVNPESMHPHHHYPDSAILYQPLASTAVVAQSKPISTPRHRQHGHGIDDGGVDASTPLAMSYQDHPDYASV